MIPFLTVLRNSSERMAALDVTITKSGTEVISVAHVDVRSGTSPRWDASRLSHRARPAEFAKPLYEELVKSPRARGDGTAIYKAPDLSVSVDTVDALLSGRVKS